MNHKISQIYKIFAQLSESFPKTAILSPYFEIMQMFMRKVETGEADHYSTLLSLFF